MKKTLGLLLIPWFFVSPAAYAFMGWMNGDSYAHHGGWWGMYWIFPLAFLVLIFLAIAVLIKLLLPQSGSEKHTALRILNERLARGEIDQAEYERIKQTLTEKPG